MSIKTFGAESSAEDCILTLDRVFTLLEDIDIKVNPSCRFAMFRRNFEQFYDHVMLAGKNPNDYKLTELLEGFRDYSELKIICSSNKLLTEARGDIQLIMSGNTLDSMDKNRTARDVQFQLSFAAHLELAGYNISVQEPDFLVEKNGLTYSVAAKRLSGKGSIYNNIVKAEKQIKNFPYPGFIVLSIERLMDEKDFVMYIEEADLSAEISYALMLKIIKKHFNPKHFTRDDQVKALVFSFSMGCISPNYEPGYSSAFTYFPIEGLSSESGQEVVTFFDNYSIKSPSFFSISQ